MFHLDTLATLVAATLTLLLGRKLGLFRSLFRRNTPYGTRCGWFVGGAGATSTEKYGCKSTLMSLRDPLMLLSSPPLA